MKKYIVTYLYLPADCRCFYRQLPMRKLMLSAFAAETDAFGMFGLKNRVFTVVIVMRRILPSELVAALFWAL